MRRATVTLPDELDQRLAAFVDAQPGRPTFTSVVEAALDSYLSAPPAPPSRIVSVLRHRAAIVDAATELRAGRIGVFGSVAQGEDGPDSDIDFWVDRGEGMTLFEIAALRHRLAALLDSDVDVVTLDSIPAEMRAEILAASVEL